jgi:hypothetical protein
MYRLCKVIPGYLRRIDDNRLSNVPRLAALRLLRGGKGDSLQRLREQKLFRLRINAHIYALRKVFLPDITQI